MTSAISVELELDGTGLSNDILLNSSVSRGTNLKRRMKKGYSTKLYIFFMSLSARVFKHYRDLRVKEHSTDGGFQITYSKKR